MTRPPQPAPYPGDARTAQPARTEETQPRPVSQPRPYPGDLAARVGVAHYRRTYSDPLGRPLTGQVVIDGGRRSDNGTHVVLAVAVTVPVTDDGILDVHLPPGTYQLTASLRTADGTRVTDVDTIDLADKESP